MVTRLTATAQVDFLPNIPQPSVKITGHPEVSDGTLGIPLRCYPADCKLVASVGTITEKSRFFEDVQGEMIRFSGDSAQLQFMPVGSSPSIEFVFGFDSQGESMIVGPTLTLDSKLGSIKSTKMVGGVKVPFPFYGLVKVGAYRSEYKLFYYKPEISYSVWGGLIVRYGSIAAYKEGGIDIFDVPLSRDTESRDKFELYRIVSKKVIDPKGEWEYPPNWDTYTGKYPDDKVGPDKDTSVVEQRVHEIGYMTSSGYFWTDRFPQGLRSPYDPVLIKVEGTPQFQPVVEMVEQSLAHLFPGPGNSGMRDRAAYCVAERKKYPYIQ